MARTLYALCTLLLAFTISQPLRASEREVDLLLVLAVDVSASMDPEEQELQRQGFVEAFRSPHVHRAIARGAIGRIAVTYMEWAGASDQRVLMPWTVIYGAEDAMAFADQLSSQPIRRGQSTSISAAIDTAVSLIGQSGFTAIRRVIDVSGDGINNQGRAVTEARDNAVAAGITVNGLPIMLDRMGVETRNLDVYYRDCVIGGLGAFVIPVQERQQFVAAIKTKIVVEVSGRTSRRDLILPTNGTPKTSCAPDDEDDDDPD
jgi:hypothetical protein